MADQEIDYERDIRIDETALDVEWLEQPRLMQKYCENAARAHAALDTAKVELDLVKAELSAFIRKSPGKFGLEKVTEGAIDAAVQMHPQYKKAMARYIEVKFESEVASNAVRSFDQRKSALENLVRLHGASYFAGPKMPRNLTEERNARTNKMIRMRRTRRKASVE